MQMLHNVWEFKSVSNSISITVTEYSDQRNIGKIVQSFCLEPSLQQNLGGRNVNQRVTSHH